MGEFFRFPLRFFNGLEWRQKMELAALIIALACIGEWMRSFVLEDEISLSIFGRLHVCDSAIGTIRWMAWDDHGWLQSIEWHTGTIPLKETEWDSRMWESRVRQANESATFWGFNFQHSLRSWVIPYWPIVVLLTLLSAFLLLSKPRKPSSIKIIEPIPVAGP